MYSHNNYGTWLRPNELLYGIDHEKLFISEVLAHDTIIWQTLRKQFSSELKTHILTNVIKDHVWNLLTIDTALFEETLSSNLSINISNDLSADLSNDLSFDPDQLVEYNDDIDAKPIFADSNVKSYLEMNNIRDIMWSRIYDLRNMMVEHYVPSEIVWKVEKHWTHDSQYAKSDSIELTLWLDEYTKTISGNDVWTDSRTHLNSLGRLAMQYYPYETSIWTANVPDMFATSRQVYAMRNANELMMSYIANDPLNIKYVIMSPVLKSTFNDMKSKEEEWSLYANYRKDNPYKLYGENNYFKDNSIY